jgi:hypothetical protein
MEEYEKKIYESLKGQTYRDKLVEINDRLFMLDMQDTWDYNDYDLHDILINVKKFIEKEINDER